MIDQDQVQLHSACWRPLRTDISDAVSDVDFLLWPRSDIERIECLVYSNWKHEPNQPHQSIEVNISPGSMHFKDREVEANVGYFSGNVGLKHFLVIMKMIMNKFTSYLFSQKTLITHLFQ